MKASLISSQAEQQHAHEQDMTRVDEALSLLQSSQEDGYDRALERLPESIVQAWEQDLERGVVSATAQDS